MTRLLQHLQRRALVVLAWLVLAVAVPAPAFTPAEAPLAALIAARPAPARTPVAAVPRGDASAHPADAATETQPPSSPARAGSRRGALARAAGQAPARDGRHLYLETLTLLC